MGDSDRFHDAVLFSSGPQALVFGAGVVHARVAIALCGLDKRARPIAVGGVSTGVLNAAALQRALWLLDNGEGKGKADARAFLARYVAEACGDPVGVFFESLPGRAELHLGQFDTCLDGSAPEYMIAREAEFIHKKMIVVGHARFLLGTKLSVAGVASLVEAYFFMKEERGWLSTRWKVVLLGRATWLLALVFLERLTAPLQWRSNRDRKPFGSSRVEIIRPRGLARGGLARLVRWGRALFCLSWLLISLIAVQVLPRDPLGSFVTPKFVTLVTFITMIAAVVAFFFMVCALLLAAFLKQRMKGWHGLLHWAAKGSGIGNGLSTNYPTLRRVVTTFEEAGGSVMDMSGAVPMLASLAVIDKNTTEAGVRDSFALDSNKLFEKHGDKAIVELLETALAVPGLYGVFERPKEWVPDWASRDGVERGAEQSKSWLIDGGVIRDNPLPMFYRWLKAQTGATWQASMKEQTRALVVYGVPSTHAPDRGSGSPKSDLTSVGLEVLRLLKRTDMDMEIRQSEYVSTLVKYANKLQESGKTIGHRTSLRGHALTPLAEIDTYRIAAQKSGYAREVAAAGCKRAMERWLEGRPFCEVHPRWRGAENSSSDEPALPLCASCDGVFHTALLGVDLTLAFQDQVNGRPGLSVSGRAWPSARVAVRIERGGALEPEAGEDSTSGAPIELEVARAGSGFIASGFYASSGVHVHIVHVSADLPGASAGAQATFALVTNDGRPVVAITASPIESASDIKEALVWSNSVSSPSSQKISHGDPITLELPTLSSKLWFKAVVRPAGELLGLGFVVKLRENKFVLERLSGKFGAGGGINLRPGQKVVVVTNGGVFKGSFHIGMIAALVQAGIRPHAVFGASVGSLMGAALARICIPTEEEKKEKSDAPDGFPKNNGPLSWAGKPGDEGPSRLMLLAQMVLLFRDVPARVAYTRRLTRVANELFARAQGTEQTVAAFFEELSAGVRFGDDSLGAIAHLFGLPAGIARQILESLHAGDPFGALGLFIDAVAEHTLPGLGAEEAVMGADLLRQGARNLLKTKTQPLGPMVRQPYAGGMYPTHFYCTATNLNDRTTELLGVGDNEQAYDFVEALLASSAFPVLFSPVPQSRVDRAKGDPNVLYCDGGIFDNLPIHDAMSYLAACQRSEPSSVQRNIQTRLSGKHLVIMGALNAAAWPQKGEPGTEEDRLKHDPYFVWARAKRLRNNYKIAAYERHAKLVNDLAGSIINSKLFKEAASKDEFEKELRGVALADVLKVEPSDDEHLNGAFAFSPVAGFDPARLQKSIANGCFETFRSLARGLENSAKVVSFSTETKGSSTEAKGSSTEEACLCPYFTNQEGHSFECPFAMAKKEIKPDIAEHLGFAKNASDLLNEAKDFLEKIYVTCKGDKVHEELRTKAPPQTDSVNSTEKDLPSH